VTKLLLAALLAGTTAFVAEAQRPGGRAPRPLNRVPPAQAGGQAAADDSGSRARLESEIRRGFARAVKQRVGLTDAQITRLVPVTQRYEQQRRQLQMRERDTRVTLRNLMTGSQTPDSAQVDRLLKTLVDIPKERAALLEAEQRDLATIMSPVQRARFMAMQDQIRRRLEQMRQRRAPMFDGGPPGPPPKQPPPP
jgi:periplasmic protein CpxP/Spy